MKKIFACLMALVMLALPMLGLAEDAMGTDFIAEAVANGRMVEHITTFELADVTGDESLDAIIRELLDALSVKTYRQEGDLPQSGLCVALNSTDVLTFDIAFKDGDAYVSSDLLGGKTIVANADELQPIASKFVTAMVSLGMMSEEDAALALEQLEAALANETPSMPSVDYDALISGFDTAALQELALNIASHAEQADPAGQPQYSDPAIIGVTVTLTAEDIVAVYGSIFDALKGNEEYMRLLDSMLASSDSETTAAASLDEIMAQLEEKLPSAIQGDIPATFYLNGDDELIAARCSFEMLLPDDEDQRPIACNTVYTRWTTNSVTHTIRMDLERADEKMATAVFMVDADDNSSDVILHISDPDDQVSIGVHSGWESSDTEKTLGMSITLDTGLDLANVLLLTVNLHAVKLGDDAQQTTVVKLSVQGAELLTVTTESRTTAPVASIVTDDALRLAELSDEAFQSFLVDTVSALQVWLVTAMQALPVNVLMMLMGQ